MHIKENHKHPTYWGPSAWKFLHAITNAYPQHPTLELQLKTKDFFNNLAYLLPCPSCRLNYENHLKEIPLTDKVTSSNLLLSRWLIDIHNEVNKMNGKKILTYDEVLNQNTKEISFSSLLLVTIAIFIFFVFLFFKLK